MNSQLKRRGKRQIFPPSRALLAERDGQKASATWAKTPDGWRCIAARGILRPMRGVSNIEQAVQLLKGCKWEWLVPLFSKAIAPPF